MRLEGERLTRKCLVADILCPGISRHSKVTKILNGQVIIASYYPKIAFFTPARPV